MNRDNWLLQRPKELPSELLIVYRWENSFTKIGNFDSQVFDRPRELARGMPGGFQNLGWSAKQIFNATPAQIFFKNPVGIVEITNNQIEIRKIVGQFCRQCQIPGEKARERPVFDRAYCLRVKAVFRERRDVLVTKNLDVCIRTGVTQRLE